MDKNQPQHKAAPAKGRKETIMTNTKIIKDAAVAAGLYTEAEAADLICKLGALPIHTFAEWKRLGYSVKKGEKACLHLYLWKYTTKPNKDERDKAAEAGKELEEDPHYYKKYSHLFHFSQVRRTNAPEPAEG